MAKVAIVTDSTASVPEEFIKKYPIWVAPQVLIWGSEVLKDGVDIQPNEFYERLVNDPVHPTTSQVTPASFDHIFKKLLGEGYDILAILISPKLSGTVDSAMQVKALLSDANIEVFNSNSVSMAMGFQVLMAARAASEGASLAECREVAEKARPLTGVFFAVDTLDYLYKGGRIGGGSKFLGTVLNIRPILEIKEGAVESAEKVRTRKKSIARMIELVEQQVGNRTPVHISALHAKSPEEAKQLLTEASQRFNAVESIFTEVSPVLGTHAGPGTVGLAYLAGI